MKKTTKSEAEAVLHQALIETNNRLAGGYLQPLDSVKHQIEYLIDALNDRNDKQRLGEITVGRYAAYEFEASDPAYAEVLYKVSALCSLIAKGRVL
jgi:Tsi6